MTTPTSSTPKTCPVCGKALLPSRWGRTLNQCDTHLAGPTELAQILTGVRAATGRRRLERTTAQAQALRRERKARHGWTDPLAEPASSAIPRRIAALYREEIERRGGEVTIEQRDSDVEVTIRDSRGGLHLLHAEGWRQYSRSYGARPATLSYLCGTDDSGRWAVRVPGTIRTVASALGWIEPAAVQQARLRGRRVLRQGDVYAIETSRAHDGGGEDLPDSHRWDDETRTLHHDGHAPMHVPFPARFFRQRALEMGRSGRYGMAD